MDLLQQGYLVRISRMAGRDGGDMLETIESSFDLLLVYIRAPAQVPKENPLIVIYLRCWRTWPRDADPRLLSHPSGLSCRLRPSQ